MMSKGEYIAELRSRLRDLSDGEIEDAISYCEEYFEDAGIENEQQVIEELGSPAKFAAQIRAEAVIRQKENRSEINRDKNPKTSMKNVVVIFLGICALPLALPLAFAAIVLFFAFVLVIISLLFATIVSVGAIIIAGVPLIISGISNIGNPGNALVAFGGGCLSIGLGLLLFIMFIYIIGMLIPAFLKAVTRLYNKARGGKRYEKA